MALDLFTCSYAEFRPAMGVPVRSSLGAPRYRLPFELTHAIRAAMPERSMLRMTDQVAFDVRYRALLERRGGVDAVLSEARAIAAAAGDGRLVILCFEDLAKPGQWCHRTLFAHWWAQRTGDAVRELGATGMQAPWEQDALM